jgi:sugar phosphate isomerase/epimerase
MAPYLATVHLHDNNGSEDQHLIPGFGSIPWNELPPLINGCSQLRHVETEAFNKEKWEHARLYAHYSRLLGQLDTERRQRKPELI